MDFSAPRLPIWGAGRMHGRYVEAGAEIPTASGPSVCHGAYTTALWDRTVCPTGVDDASGASELAPEAIDKTPPPPPPPPPFFWTNWASGISRVGPQPSRRVPWARRCITLQPTREKLNVYVQDGSLGGLITYLVRKPDSAYGTG